MLWVIFYFFNVVTRYPSLKGLKNKKMKQVYPGDLKAQNSSSYYTSLILLSYQSKWILKHA